jgi:ribonuclease BN (tRNA processing enzyme)
LGGAFSVAEKLIEDMADSIPAGRRRKELRLAADILTADMRTAWCAALVFAELRDALPDSDVAGRVACALEAALSAAIHPIPGSAESLQKASLARVAEPLASDKHLLGHFFRHWKGDRFLGELANSLSIDYSRRAAVDRHLEELADSIASLPSLTQNAALAARDAEVVLLQTLEQRKSGRTRDSVLYGLRKWSSYTPRLGARGEAGSADNGLGGGFFLAHNKHGVVVDPGPSFCSMFLDERRGFGIRDVDAVIVTHAHDDHCHDLDLLLSLASKLKRRTCGKNAHSVRVGASQAALNRFNALLEANRIGRVCISTSAPKSVTKLLQLAQIPDIQGQAFVTRHDEVPWLPKTYPYSGYGLTLTLTAKSGLVRSIGFTSDTGYHEDLATALADCDVVVANVGNLHERGRKSRHLGIDGVVRLACDLAQQGRLCLLLLSEFGRELGAARGDIAAAVSCAMRLACPGVANPPLVLPTDDRLVVDLVALEVKNCVTGAWLSVSDGIRCVNADVDSPLVYQRPQA